MTDVKIIFNPIDLDVKLFYDNKEILSTDNKVYAFLKTEGFHNSLIPLNRKYIIWQGLLPELVNEFNDDELNIVFEGRIKDFEEVKNAFENAESILENIGYENNYHLSFLKNYEAENLTDRLISIAKNVREMCETRNELNEIDRLVSGMITKDLSASQRVLQEIIDRHIKKWNESNDKHKKSKVDFLLISSEQLKESSKYIPVL